MTARSTGWPILVTASTYAEFGPRAKGLGGWGADILPPPQRCDVDDLLTAHVKFDNGAVLVLEASWAAYLRSGNRVQVLGTEMGADLYPTLYGTDNPIRLYADMGGDPVEIIPDLPRSTGLGGHAEVIAEWVAHLDDRARCIRVASYPHAAGPAGSSIGSILGDAANSGARGLMLAHRQNPSEDGRRCRSGRAATHRLADAADALDITVVDHLVFAGDTCTSMRRAGLL